MLKKEFLKAILSMAYLLLLGFYSNSSIVAQESRDWFFMGYLYHNESDNLNDRYPYMQVALSKLNNPDKILAVTFSNFEGEYSFYGTAINPLEDYVITLYIKDKTQKYIIPHFDSTPSFKGNINAHIKLKPNLIYFDKENLKISDDEKTLTVKDFLLKQNKFLYEDEFWLLQSIPNKSLKISLNNLSIDENKLIEILSLLPLNKVKQITLYKELNEQSFYSGLLLLDVDALPRPQQNQKVHFFSLKELK